MPRQPRQASAYDIHHVMLRGVNRDAIFLEDADRQRFLDCLAAAKTDSGCRVLAYCLMGNHVHLVLQTTIEPIGAVVKRLGVRYAGWFNRKYGRVGHLFQDRFKSVPVEGDAYLLTLVRYVWNNPVVAGIVPQAELYPWSSRRLLGQSGSLIDDDQLRRLIPWDALTSVREPAERSQIAVSAKIGRPTRYDDEQAIGILRSVCGVSSPSEFGSLDQRNQREAVHRLRAHSVPYDQIARITGLSSTAAKRLQASSEAAEPRDGAPSRADEKRTVPF